MNKNTSLLKIHSLNYIMKITIINHGKISDTCNSNVGDILYKKLWTVVNRSVWDNVRDFLKNEL